MMLYVLTPTKGNSVSPKRRLLRTGSLNQLSLREVLPLGQERGGSEPPAPISGWPGSYSIEEHLGLFFLQGFEKCLPLKRGNVMAMVCPLNRQKKETPKRMNSLWHFSHFAALSLSS